MSSDAAPAVSRALQGRAILTDPLVQGLLGARLVAVLATLEPDGSIHAVPMWFATAGDAVVLATGSGSRKARNLERDERATLVLHDSRSGFEVCGVTMRGNVELVRGAAAAPLIESVHARYLTRNGLSLEEARTFLAADDVAVLFRPASAVTWDERGNVAAAVLQGAGGALPLEPTSSRLDARARQNAPA